jgi:hypothetical protein
MHTYYNTAVCPVSNYLLTCATNTHNDRITMLRENTSALCMIVDIMRDVPWFMRFDVRPVHVGSFQGKYGVETEFSQVLGYHLRQTLCNPNNSASLITHLKRIFFLWRDDPTRVVSS